MQTPTPNPFPALLAAGISYDQLVALFSLVRERASTASAADMLEFLREDLSDPKFAHLPAEQRARLQISLRALQEYALDVWRFTPHASALAFSPPSGSFPAVTVSGVYAAAPASGSFPAVSASGVYATPASGSYPALSPSGAYPAAPASGSFPAVSPSGAYQAVAQAPKKRGLFRRMKDALSSVFGRSPRPAAQPILSTAEIAAAFSGGK